MSEAADAIEVSLMEEADAQINKMIPAGGLDTFGDPEEMMLYGLGAVVGSEDLLTKGGSASFGHISIGDLAAVDLVDEGGSSAFGQFLVAAQGERLLPEMDGMGDLGRIAWGKWWGRMKTLRATKKAKAKKVLKSAATEAKTEAKNAAVLEKRAFSKGVGPIQRDELIKRAQFSKERSKKALQIAKGAAREAVAPRIRRHEAKAAMRPILKEVAQKVAQSGAKTIRRVAKVAAGAPPEVQKAIVQKVGKEAIKESIAKEMTGQKTPAAGAKVMQKMRKLARPFGGRLAQKVAGTRVGKALAKARGRMAAVGKKVTRPFGGRLAKRWGLRGLGSYEDVTNPPETADIIDDWQSDEVYGEPLY